VLDGPYQIYALIDENIDAWIAAYEPDRLYALWHEEMALSGSSARVPTTVKSLEELVHTFIDMRFRTEKFEFCIPDPVAVKANTQAMPLYEEEQEKFENLLVAALERREDAGLL